MRKLSFMWLAVFAAMFIIPMVVAVEFEPITPEEQQTFDEILVPVLRVYNMIKYISSAIAALVLLIAGAMYISSGSDPKKRDNAKVTCMYVLIGLALIWAAPLVVNFIVG